MVRKVRRLWIGVGASAAASLILGQAVMASAATTGQARPAITFSCAIPYNPPPSTVNLTLKSSGPYVLALQERLRCLHYWVGPVNGTFGWDTMFAVWAFKEVQSGKIVPPNPNVVDAATQLRLVNPVSPPKSNPRGGATRIEVLKRIQVMVLYKNNHVFLISHVSTARYCRTDGCGWVTPDGKYRALYWIKGPVYGHLGPLWNPVVFTSNGAYAIHGDLNPRSLSGINAPNVVGLRPQSHGCVRIPMDLSKVFYKNLKFSSSTGTPIYISGPAHQ